MSTTFIKLFRYDPSADSTPYYKTYEVPWKEYLTVLEALHYINDNIEQITFDYSCKASLCGRCSMRLNGTPVLACYKTLTEGTINTIEPLDGFPVIRDLMIDRTQMYKKLQSTDLSLNTTKSLHPDKAPKLDYEYYWNVLERINMCRECGNCMSVCPVYAKDSENYLGPAPLAQIALRANDGFDARDRVFQAVLGGVFRCIGCGQCSKVCPSYINHPVLFKEMKEKAIANDQVPADEGIQAMLNVGQAPGKLY